MVYVVLKFVPCSCIIAQKGLWSSPNCECCDTFVICVNFWLFYIAEPVFLCTNKKKRLESKEIFWHFQGLPSPHIPTVGLSTNIT